MHRIAALTLVALAVACYEGADAPVEPTPTPSSDLRILGGAVECDGCSQLEFSIGGPDLQWVTSASFVSSDDPPRVLRAQIELRRFTGDSGVVLQARASFISSSPLGDYDLELLTPGRPGSAGAMRVERALRVTGVAPPAPVPPGTPVPPAPPLPSGNLRISVTVDGADLDSRFLARSSGCAEYYDLCFSGEVSVGSPLQLRLPASAYRFRLFDVAPNCTVTSTIPADVTIVADSTSELTFAVRCLQLGFVEVLVPVTGSDVQDEFIVECFAGDCPYGGLRAPGPLRLALAPGAYQISLPSRNLQANCSVLGADVIAVQVTSGATAQISFPVTCLPFGEIRVTVNAPTPGHVYRVHYPEGCDNYYVLCNSLGVVSGSVASIRVPAGAYGLSLLDLPTNCRVTSANPANVTVTSGTATDLVFDIACP